MPSLATFNANNFFLRYKFASTYPGDMSKASLVEATEAAVGYMPNQFGNYSVKNYIVWDPTRREVAATALMEPDGKLPDILCLQEVESIEAIRVFNNRYLGGHYPYSLLIDAYDPRNIDVGVLSKYPIREVRSHVDDTKSGKRIFSRDCLEVTIDIYGQDITLFLNHFKSKLVRSTPANTFKKRLGASHGRRLAQAKKVAELVSERFKGQHDTALYAVVGDFNDTPYSPYVKPLVSNSKLTDVVAAHRPVDDRWTYFWRSRNRVSQIDYVLGSKEFARRVAKKAQANSKRKPYIERGGLAYKEGVNGILQPKLVHFEADDVTPKPFKTAPANKKVPFDFDRYATIVENWKNNISDHCPVKVWF